MLFLKILILGPSRIAAYLQWAAPLLARVVVGYVFMLTGWGKFQNLAAMIDNFREWSIPFPEIMTPFVSGLELFGGAFLMLGFFTRIFGGGLAITMVVAILAAKGGDIDTLATLLGFEEALYFTIFTWLAIAGAGKISLDAWVEKSFNNITKA